MKRSQSRSFWCITAVLTVIVGLLGYQIIDGLTRGVVVAFSRVGPSITYTLVEQPKQYWFNIIWLAGIEIFLIAVTLVTAWIAREMAKNERST
ncbi:hypothetical protein [Pseudomonas fildesensis]|uniref:Uncharacterized protein n=1 Tax=Pseudomonas fildesensis TaxID=1674920 RepID=A0A0J8G8Q8_9PSED|nr:hypothetical protein [Pseudomonas fildesensis]KMT57138.1 hypothetical protein ACR52_00540 [Pseudomonas fildesensis]